MIPKTILAGHATEEAVASALTRDEGDAPIALSLHKGAAASLQARAKGVAKTKPGPSFAYSLPVHPVHTRRDRVASLPPCRLHGAAIQRAPPLGPGRALTLPCGWNNAGHAHHGDGCSALSYTLAAPKSACVIPATRQGQGSAWPEW